MRDRDEEWDEVIVSLLQFVVLNSARPPPALGRLIQSKQAYSQPLTHTTSTIQDEYHCVTDEIQLALFGRCKLGDD